MKKGFDEVDGCGVSDAVKGMENVFDSWEGKWRADNGIVDGTKVGNHADVPIWFVDTE